MNVDVYVDQTHHRLGTCLMKQRTVVVFPSVIPPDWASEAMTLAMVHELVHLNLGDAGEDYASEAYAKYAEHTIYDWLYGPVEYMALWLAIGNHNRRD